MKKILVSIIIICLSQIVTAQAQDTSVLYIKNPEIPPFKIYKVPDSTLFTKDDIRSKHAVLVIYFSPDCEHCQHETKELLAYKEELKDIEIIMVSSLPYEHIKSFYEEYGLNKLPNYTLAQDRAFSLYTFYKPKSFPSMFLYDKQGKFITTLSGNVAVPDLLAAFK